ncbi:hypothetical protein Glove_168g180 [Diversispora epigaea]|uniref:Uncharacterized protein n=1 Tax=Diversispora epigaea TaxID=1348612 RepID=A0A397IY35_9GLOM|nr:hypothetical protein Glove_168g180 [Diversispora epigaea]
MSFELAKLPFKIWAKEKSYNMCRMKKEVPEVFNNMSNLKLSEDNKNLFYQHTKEMDIDETDAIVEIPSLANLVITNS